MAESDADRRSAESMTEEEADRLSERFRPSWEEDVPTVPRDQPVPEPPSAAQSKPAASSPAVTSSPIVSVTKAPVIAVTEQKAVAPVVAPTAPAPAATSAPTQTPLAVPAARRPTLLGTAPVWTSGDPASASAPAPSAPIPSGPDAPAPVAAPAAASAPVAVAPILTPGPSAPDAELQIDIDVSPSSDDDSAPAVEVEAAPDSKPSGVGQKYVPKEDGAPAVMLGPEVQAAESGQSALLEAEHRARRAPTIVRMQAFDLPPPIAQPAPLDLELGAPRRSRAGIIVAASAALLIGIAVLALTLGQSSTPERPQPAADAAAPLAVTADTSAPVQPPAAPAAVAPPISEPRAIATTAPLVTPKLSSPAQKPVATRSSPSTKAVTAKGLAPKSATGGTKPSGKSVIVRENPF